MGPETYIKGGENLSVDDLLYRFALSWSPLYIFYVMMLSIYWLSSPFTVYLPVFAGIKPTNESFKCLTETCEALRIANGTEALCMEHTFPNNTKEPVIKPREYSWQMDRTSFVVDLELYCKRNDADVTLVSSMYFVGALIGLLISGYLLDNIGRKKGCIMGATLAMVASFIGTFCRNYEFLLIIRVLQGMGNFVVITGAYVLLLEILPAKLRNFANGYSMILWAMGYPLAALISYLIPTWNYLFLASTILIAIVSVSIIFMIESPRYFIICGDYEAAKASLERLAGMARGKFDIQSVNLQDDGKEGGDKARSQSIGQQLKEFLRHPVMLGELVIQMFTWFVSALSFYGFNFGWSSILPDIYIGYLLASIGELIAYVAAVPVIHALGRRCGMIVFFGGAIVSYLIAILDVDLGGGYTLESISCLVGLVFVSAAFGGIYLYTAELAPTSHRGMFFALCSSSARIGSFLGPYAIGYLFDITHKAIPLGILAFLCALCALGMLFLVETGDRKIPDVAAEVTERRKGFKIFGSA